MSSHKFNPEAAEFTPRTHRQRQLGELATNLDDILFGDEADEAKGRVPRVSTTFGLGGALGDDKDFDDAGGDPEGAGGDPEGAGSDLDRVAFEEAVKAEVRKRMVALEDEWEARKQAAMEKADMEMDEKFSDLVAKSVVKAMEGRKSSASPTKSKKEDTVTINGMEFRSTPRSATEIEEDDTSMSKHDRYALDDASKEKLKSKACAPLKVKFEHLDYEKLLDGSSGADLGKMLLGHQTVMKAFNKWAASYDIKGIFSMPDVDDFTDTLKMANAPKIDLLKDYKRVLPSRVWRWQEAVKTLLPRPDVESSSWALTKLEHSIEENLLVQLTQSLSRLPEVKQGGVSLFYALAVALDANDHEHKRLVTDYINNHKLSDTKGEDVAVSSSCFVAAARSLRANDVPSDIVEVYLNSMLESQCEEFKVVVNALIGNYHAVGSFGLDSSADLLDKLDIYSTKLSAKYRAFLKKKTWPAASTAVDSGGFKAAAANFQRPAPQRPAPQAQLQDGLVPPTPRWQQWYDSSTCAKCGKKGHPTKYCGDVGARNRPYRPRVRPADQQQERRRVGARQPSFKSSSHKRDFTKKVHNLLLEAVDEKDHELFAHLAGEEDTDDQEPEMYANLAGEEDELDAGNGNDGDDDAAALAFAAMGLGSLNWKAA